LEVRILGPLEVLGTARVELAGQRERALLARLLLAPNQVVSSERLIDDVWEDAPPDNAMRALPVYISRLRKALRGGHIDDVIVTCAPGYMLRLAPDDLDAARFEALVATSRDQAANAEGASATLVEALALWRGPALADVTDMSFARAEAARLEEARLSALEDRIDADLACGRHSALIGELAALVAAHPLRERLWGQRMLALYRAGRQSEALRAYQELRGILGQELGIEPSVAVNRLETAILRHDEGLEWKPVHPPLPPTPPASATEGVSETGVVTFLFTDVVGSTELLGRLGDEAAEEVRRRQVDVLRAAVASEGGSEVKNLGDGLMVVFTSPLAAVRCAVAIQQGIDRDNREAGTHVQMRVGLHAGEPLRHEDDYFGTPVVVAKRLCDRAQGSQILASALVRGLVGNRGGFTFRDRGDLALKGLDAPVPAFEVCWIAASDEAADQAEPPAAVTVPLPPFLTDVGRIFVGRDAEVARLEQLWKEAAAGERRVTLLAGEPGVGKTRLAAEVARRAYRAGAVVLAGRCDEDLGVPYQPFVEALRHFADHVPTGQLRRCLGRYGGELGRLVPELVEQVPGLPAPLHSDPETERYRLFDAVAAWLAATSAEAPLLVVLDDLQWAARPTALLLRHVVHSAESMRLLILGTYRDSELTHDHPLVELIAHLHRQGGMQRLALSGLDDTGVAAFVEQVTRRALDDDGIALAHAIYAETDGNPFFVREVLRHLRETGAVEEREEGWFICRPIDELGIPEGVRDVVGRRLSHLSNDAYRMLRVAAVVGAEFDLRVLQAADVLDEDDLLGALEEATATRLVLEMAGTAPRYRFAHALVRDTLYAELSAARRTTLHRRVAEAIETVHGGRLDDHLPALAHHWARAAAPTPETDRAVDYATRAGDRALAQLAHDEAATYYGQALELLDARAGPSDDARRIELLIALGEAQRRAGDPAFRDTLLDAAGAARQRGDADALARAALANYRGFWSATSSVDDERVAVLEAALRASEPGDSPLRARLLANLASELQFSKERGRRRALSDEALAMARRLGDLVTVAHVILARCSAIWEAGNPAERLVNTTELLTMSDAIGDPAVSAWTSVWRFVAAAELADREKADRSLEAVANLSAELGQPTLRWVAAYLDAGWLLLAGRLADAEDMARKARELGVSAGQPDAPTFFGIQRFHINLHRGRLGELVERTSRALAEHRYPDIRALLGLALAYSESDREDDARRAWERLVPQLADEPPSVRWLDAMADSAAVCAYLGDRSVAPTLLDLLLPYKDHLVGTGLTWSGSVSHYLGLLAATLTRFEDADAYFTAAAAIHARLGAPILLARTRLEWARMLLARRRPEDAERAHDLLEQAVTTARELGLGNVERRAVELLTSG
jgi:DNA-binding SARP family transcriptional activator/class 3 adenylate cyclase/tetratricopeptide (TPR) repeat protein